MALFLTLQLEVRSHLSVEEHVIVSFCLCVYLLPCSHSSLQASGYGSGDDAYEDIEARDEVKKIVEEREYTMVCTCTRSHTTLSLCPSHLSGLDLDQRKQLLSLQTWWGLEHGDMC